jgi:hypothetical protein
VTYSIRLREPGVSDYVTDSTLKIRHRNSE